MGPFMPAEQRAGLPGAGEQRSAGCTAITFEARVEPFFERASAVVAMGGYNTFCEILSFGKPALMVPRTTPRLEQYLRAERAQKLGLVRMLANDGVRAPARMAAALRELPSMPVPPASVRAPMLEGLGRIEQPDRALARRRAATCQSCAAAATRRWPWPAASPSWSRAIRACPRPSSPRRSWRWSGWACRSRSSPCATRPTAGFMRCTARSGAPVSYLPEYLYQEPLRVLRALWPAGAAGAASGACWPSGSRDLRRDLTANRGRRLGQALVLAAELPAEVELAARALPAHAGLGRPLHGHPARPAVQHLGARQGCLDHPGLGEAREDRRRAVAGDLQPDEPRPSARCWRRRPTWS